jgi:hypothetical protein
MLIWFTPANWVRGRKKSQERESPHQDRGRGDRCPHLIGMSVHSHNDVSDSGFHAPGNLEINLAWRDELKRSLDSAEFTVTPAIESGKATVEAAAVEAASPVPKSETKDPGLRGWSCANEASFTALAMTGVWL